MALMPIPTRIIDDRADIIRRYAAAALRGIDAAWCNHDVAPPPDADWAHSGITRVPFLIVCESGGFRVEVREHGVARTVAMRAGMAVLHGPGAYCWHQHRGPARMLSTTFDTDHLLLGAGICRRGRDLDDPSDFAPMRALVLRPPPPEPLVALARAALACPAADAERRLALLKALLWQLADAAAASTPSAGPALAIRAWITARAAQPGLGRNAVARAFGLSPTHVSRLLAPCGGVGAEIERIRLERAQDLLARDPDITLAAVAGATGFTDASHLVRRFRLRHGVTPAAWRRHHQSLASPA